MVQVKWSGHEVVATLPHGQVRWSQNRPSPAREAWGRILEVGLVKYTSGDTAEVSFGVFEEYMRWYGAKLVP